MSHFFTENEEPEYKKIAELLHDYLSNTFDVSVDNIITQFTRLIYHNLN